MFATGASGAHVEEALRRRRGSGTSTTVVVTPRRRAQLTIAKQSGETVCKSQDYLPTNYLKGVRSAGPVEAAVRVSVRWVVAYLKVAGSGSKRADP